MLASSFVYMNFPPVHFDSLFPGRRNITNGDYSDNIWERKNLNGEWHWKEGSLHDPGFMMNKTTFGRPPPQVLFCSRCSGCSPFASVSLSYPVFQIFGHKLLDRIKQAPEIVPARPNPQREAFLNLPFLPAGLRGMSSQKVK
jgi:hypothetical protein